MDKNYLLSGSLTANYKPSVLYYPSWWTNSGPGIFGLTDVEAMKRDNMVKLALKFIKAPLYTTEWVVRGKNKAINNYVNDTLQLFWKPHINKLLRAIEYGFSTGEVIYRLKNGKIWFYDFKDFHPRDTRVLTLDGEYYGVRVKHFAGTVGTSVDIRPPKALWFAVDREYTNWYGRSYLIAAWDSWYEKRSRDGAIDIRRLWFYKNAFSGGVIRHPETDFVQPDGTIIPSRELAREMLERLKTGGLIAFPNSRDASGQYLWEYEPPHINSNATEIRQYPQDLDNEVTRGIGIPDSVLVDPPGAGGYSARRVPERAFFVMLEEVLSEILYTLKYQMLDPLVRLNYEEEADYTIETKPLIDIMSAEGTPPVGGPGEATNASGGGNNNTIGSLFSQVSMQVNSEAM